MSLKKYEGLISRMCRELAKLYITKEDARAVAGRASLNINEIPFSDKSIDTWKKIITWIKKIKLPANNYLMMK